MCHTHNKIEFKNMLLYMITEIEEITNKIKKIYINRGIGAGGSETTKSGQSFEKQTCIE